MERGGCCNQCTISCNNYPNPAKKFAVHQYTVQTCSTCCTCDCGSTKADCKHTKAQFFHSLRHSAAVVQCSSNFLKLSLHREALSLQFDGSEQL